MRIVDNNNLGNTSLAQTTRATEAQPAGSTGKGAATTASTPDADGLQISKFAGSLSQVIEGESASRSQRVSQLAAAVQSGTYQVDSAKVSRAIVDHAIAAQNEQQ